MSLANYFNLPPGANAEQLDALAMLTTALLTPLAFGGVSQEAFTVPALLFVTENTLAKMAGREFPTVQDAHDADGLIEIIIRSGLIWVSDVDCTGCDEPHKIGLNDKAFDFLDYVARNKVTRFEKRTLDDALEDVGQDFLREWDATDNG